MTAKTSQFLADTLRAAGLEALALRAEADEFHDYRSPHATPELVLAQLLADAIGDVSLLSQQRAAAFFIRQRLIDGEFDASFEESEEWAASEDGRATMAALTADHPPGRKADSQTAEVLRTIAQVIDETLNGPKGSPRKNGFVLMVYPHNAALGARVNYVSNSDRRDVLVALKELVARFEGQADVEGRA